MKEKLTDWNKRNEPAENLIYRKGFYDQCNFVATTLMRDMFIHDASNYNSDLDYDKRIEIIDNFVPFVIGTHRSKSVLLPVMEMDLSKIGLKIILRCNFYDWCISVESEKDIDCDFMGLITDQKGYFEGFPKDRIYDKYSETNKKNFSLCLSDNYDVYTFIFLLRNYLINSK